MKKIKPLILSCLIILVVITMNAFSKINQKFNFRRNYIEAISQYIPNVSAADSYPLNEQFILYLKDNPSISTSIIYSEAATQVMYMNDISSFADINNSLLLSSYGYQKTSPFLSELISKNINYKFRISIYHSPSNILLTQEMLTNSDNINSFEHLYISCSLLFESKALSEIDINQIKNKLYHFLNNELGFNEKITDINISLAYTGKFSDYSEYDLFEAIILEKTSNKVAYFRELFFPDFHLID